MIAAAMAGTLPGTRRSIAAVVAFAALAPAPALAQGSPPPPLPDEAAIYQYREALPTGAGPVAPGPGTKRVTPLPAQAQAALEAQGGADTSLLERVATSSDYGAPSGPQTREAGGRPRGVVASPLPDASFGRGVEAAAAALGGENPRILVLLAAMLALGGAFAVGARRARI
jgi:hypothetical protein